MIKIRPYQETDKNFVVDMWLRSFYSKMTGYKMPFSVFHKNHQKFIHKGLENEEFLIFVACIDSDPDCILGFICIGTDRTLHYVVVKEAYKKMGISKALLNHCFKTSNITVSHYTKDLNYLKAKYKLTYDPYRFFKGV